MAALPGGLLVGDHDGAGRAARRPRPHGGIDGGVVVDVRGRETRADAVDIERHHTNSRRKLMSTARAEWVMAPEETKSAPVSA